MESALAAARGSDTRRLYRWPGGYWMPRMRAEGEISPPYGSYHGTQTIRGLLSRGLLVPVEKMPGGDPWVVEVSASDVITAPSSP